MTTSAEVIEDIDRIVSGAVDKVANGRQIVSHAQRRRVGRRGHRILGPVNVAETAAAGTINSPSMRTARKGGATGVTSQGPKRRI